MAGDVYFDSVKLLLPLDGENNGTTFTDYSKNPLVVSRNNAVTSTAAAKFGGSSAYFNGSTAYLAVANGAILLHAADFTIECWVYATSLPPSNWQALFSNFNDSGANNGLRLLLGPYGQLLWGSTTANIQTANSVISLNTWTHVAITVSNGTGRIFVNGINVGESANAAPTASTVTFKIGSTNGSAWFFAGYIDDFRVTVGVSRYTANFTPPTEANGAQYWQLSCSLAESLVATNFLATAHNLATGALIGSASVSSPGSFGINVSEASPCVVTVRPVYSVWKGSTSYALNAKVFPKNPSATPYYYKRLVAGMSGATEPTWPTTPGGKCNDGAQDDAWALVERLIQPITHGPLIPT
jgi:hypothetical protein